MSARRTDRRAHRLRRSLPPALALLLGIALAGAASAQATNTPGPPAPAPPPAARPTLPDPSLPVDGSSPDGAAQRVEITGAAPDDTAQRRQSTAAKIVIGRDEIDRFGDSSVGEIMKRLPGVSVQGPPGRGGNVRMRGMGNGYTQILVDGERMAPGFSLDSLAPEQIERIEILRAPTAETGARAIAGTINIITREGYRKRLNEVRLSLGLESGRLQPGGSWTHNDSAGDLAYSTSLSLFRQDRESDSIGLLTRTDDASGAPLLAQREDFRGRDERSGLHATTRLQWKLGATDTLVFAPMLVLSRGGAQRQSTLTQSIGADPPPYTASDSDGHSRFGMLRASGQWNHVLDSGARMELRTGANLSQSAGHTLRDETGTPDGVTLVLDDTSHSRDSGANAAWKYALLLDDRHSLVAGVEGEGNRHDETHTTLQNAVPLLTDFGDNLQASVLRWAAYAQDEWSPSKTVAVNAGLRWEQIATEGEDDDNHRTQNTSTVWTPMLHMVWKPAPKSADQVRLSLTRSYRSPTLQNLLGRPTLSRGDNTPTQPDHAGNAELQPELASGLDLALEHYLGAGGLFSANLFVRRIHQLIRNLTTLQDVSWSPGVPRWVSRPQNVGDALTEGIELEAKLRLSELWPQAPRIDTRANLSLYRSRVQGVAGPDNRIDQQPGMTLNLGADYKLAATPVTVGGNINWTPGYLTQQSSADDAGGIGQQAVQGAKRVLDAYLLWVLQPGAQLRLSASNVGPRDYVTGTVIDAGGFTEASSNIARTTLNWQVRMELKL